MTPDFRILANDQDVTAKLRDRLLSLTLTEADGESADKLELTFDDRDHAIEEPEVDATLQVWLGPRGRLSDMGRFTVEGYSFSGPPDTLKVTATAVDLKSPVRVPMTRAWENRTLGQIVTEVAARAGLEAVVGASVAGISYPYLAQTAESDLHFLTRLARKVDATAKAASGRLVLAARADDVTASGDPKTPVRLGRGDLLSWSYDLSERAREGAVAAEVQDTATATRKRVTKGKGPVRVIRHPAASEDEANATAKAALDKSSRDQIEIEASLARFEPDLFAGGRVTITGMRAAMGGTWHVVQVRHAFGGGALLTDFKAKGRT
ncbi:MAG: phage tail protein [Rhodobacteraceae bacterium]|nr:phage tail protein [Paracoccaceae bacterium]